MKPTVAKLVVAVGVLVLSLVIAGPLQAQLTGGSLSGTITGPPGAAVANAKVSVKNAATGQTVEAETNSAGMYNVPNLTPGNYEVSVSAHGFSTKVAEVALAAGAHRTLDLTLTAPSSNPQAPSLSELGFPASQTQGNAQEQARLDRRSHMSNCACERERVCAAGLGCGAMRCPRSGPSDSAGAPGDAIERL